MKREREREMKGGASMGSRSNGGGGGERVVVGKSESEKEKTKMRERQRRAITTNIFHGLRKHGGYQLSHRADINQVLRELAREAGWVIEPDGTTYRSTTPSAFCPLCGAGKRNATLTPTPTTSTIAVASGECSTTASPRPFTTGDSISTQLGDMSFAALYDMYGRVGATEIHHCSNDTSYAGGVVVPGMAVAYMQQEQYLQEARASNQNTPMGSPSRQV